MSRPFSPLTIEGESWLTRIAAMDRAELIEQFRTYPAPFPVDFTDDFLNAQPVDRLRHVFAGLVLHCGIAPMPRRERPLAMAA